MECGILIMGLKERIRPFPSGVERRSDSASAPLGGGGLTGASAGALVIVALVEQGADDSRRWAGPGPSLAPAGPALGRGGLRGGGGEEGKGTQRSFEKQTALGRQ